MDVSNILHRARRAGFVPVGVPDVVLDDRGRWVARMRTTSGDVALKAVAGAGSLDREVTEPNESSSA